MKNENFPPFRDIKLHLIPSYIIRNVKYNLCISGFEAAILMQTVRKHLVYEYVPIMEKTFRSGTRESCVAQRSIYVILRGNEETRSCINQVRNVLRHLLSAKMYKSIVIQGKHFKLFVSFIFFETPSKCEICTSVEKLRSYNFKIFSHSILRS